eukprot:TRINITY_DN138_c0_g1_i1.p1 TRINITY_DN138_c0_g1~~TRINITY_DN138_c0_g1_i1.p1  ORF type:complete len:127 (+),score=41.00 TRINITY_DN138_c0_g1_i1:64-444(+)
MASSGRAQQVSRQVRPLLSLNSNEARYRVIGLYKACYRQIPRMLATHNVPDFNVKTAREALRKRFDANAHIKDIRVIDMMVIKGQQDLKEVVEHWAQPTHIVNRILKPDVEEPVKDDFLSKFFRGA